jgi:hypothetical protein
MPEIASPNSNTTGDGTMVLAMSDTSSSSQMVMSIRDGNLPRGSYPQSTAP